MNRKTMMMVLAALSFMLTACGDKQAKQVLVAENKTETAVEEQTEEEILADGEMEDDGVALGDTELPAIRKAWASKTLTTIAADEEVNIERFAFAFCLEYQQYEPCKALHDYLAFPSRYDEEEADYRVVNKKKNGYLSCYMKRDLDWGIDCCYWNRKNGHKLVAFWLPEYHTSWNVDEHLLAFYDYDPATDDMTPEPSLTKKVEEAVADFDSYWVTLPAEGKDIELIGIRIFDHSRDATDRPNFLLRWNGNDFKIEQKD